jgi:ferric-dicitrate binding protein FerR (iron transport regulator)
MATACPWCKSDSQVYKLEAYWKSLAPGAPARAELAPPRAPELRWILPAACAVVAVALLASGAVWLGLLALLVAAGVGARSRGTYQAARRSLDAWLVAKYCGICDHQFAPGEAVAKA